VEAGALQSDLWQLNQNKSCGALCVHWCHEIISFQIQFSEIGADDESVGVMSMQKLEWSPSDHLARSYLIGV
jgi:hypothetical protein